MDKKEQIEFGRAWALVIVGSMLAFFVGIAANSAYALLSAGSSWKIFLIFIVSFGLFLFFAHYLSFAFENIDKFKKMSGWEFFKFWLNSKFKK